MLIFNLFSIPSTALRMCSGPLSLPVTFVPLKLNPKLSRDIHFISEWRNRLSNDFFTVEGSINFGSVKKSTPLSKAVWITCTISDFSCGGLYTPAIFIHPNPMAETSSEPILRFFGFEWETSTLLKILFLLFEQERSPALLTISPAEISALPLHKTSSIDFVCHR